MPRNTQQMRDIDKQISEKILQLRIKQGISQHELGEHLGVSYQQVHKYEKNTSRVCASRLAMIAQLLEVDISYFLPDNIVETITCPNRKRTLTSIMRNISSIKHEDVLVTLHSLIKTLAQRS